MNYKFIHVYIFVTCSLCNVGPRIHKLCMQINLFTPIVYSLNLCIFNYVNYGKGLITLHCHKSSFIFSVFGDITCLYLHSQKIKNWAV